MYCSGDMGLGGGGKIQQEIYQDERGVRAWEQSASVRPWTRFRQRWAWLILTMEIWIPSLSSDTEMHAGRRIFVNGADHDAGTGAVGP